MNEDMHSLLGRYFGGHVSEEEKDAVVRWRKASEQNAADFKLLQDIWNKSGEHAPQSFDTDRAWQKVNAKINTPLQRGRVISFWKKSAAVAAAALLILVAGLWWMLGDKHTTDTIVADAAVKQVMLEDGSTVYLRKGSMLTYPRHFARSSRLVTLSGEAFFDVAHNAEKPFIITAAETQVRVVGTSFTVNTHDNKVELVVKTGLVRFGSSADTLNRVMVAAGEKAIFAGNKLSLLANTDPNFNAWQSKQLVFKNRPLAEVAATIGDVYGIKLSLKKEDQVQLSETGFTDSFNDQPLQAVLDELSKLTTYHVRKLSDTEYEISIREY